MEKIKPNIPINNYVYSYLSNSLVLANSIMSDIFSVSNTIDFEDKDSLSSYIDNMLFFRSIIRDLNLALSSFPEDFDKITPSNDVNLNSSEKLTDDDIRII